MPGLAHNHLKLRYYANPAERLSTLERGNVTSGLMHHTKPEGRSTPMRRVLSEGPLAIGGMLITIVIGVGIMVGPVELASNRVATKGPLGAGAMPTPS